MNKEYLLDEMFHSPYAMAGFSVSLYTLTWATKKKVAKPFKIFFEDGDEGWEGLKDLCNKHLKFDPIRIPKKEIVPFQVGDLFAWKTRITATNANRIVENAASRDKVTDLLTELDSLKKILSVPYRNGIFTAEGLAGTCRNFKVPKRSLV